MSVQIDVEGLRELDKALTELNDKGMAVRIVRGAMRESAKPLIKGMKQNFPRPDPNDANTYSLSKNVKMQLERKKRRKTEAEYRIGPARVTSKPEDNTKYPIVGGLSKNPAAPNYARIIESKTGAMIRAYDTYAPTVIAQFVIKMKKHFEKQVKAAARKAAKQQ